MFYKISLFYLFTQTMLTAAVCFASPWGLPAELSDQNMKISFEVHAPWNILDGTAEQCGGKLSAGKNGELDSLIADISVQKLQYKAGLSVAGRLVAVWLRANSPTPAKFTIEKSSLNCNPETISEKSPCKGSVDGQLNIWGKNYSIDVPVEMKRNKQGFLLEGVKEIKWGEYGFGDSSSTIASLKPIIDLNFSIELPSQVNPADK